MPHKISTFISRYLGISVMLLGAVVLVTFGFGYLQHLISFSPVMDNGALGGIAIQACPRSVFSLHVQHVPYCS